MKRTLFGEEHEMCRKAFDEFLAREVVPNYERWQEEGIVSREVWRKAGDSGFLCPWVEEKYGGSGADFLFSVVTIEAMGHRHLTAPSFHLHNEIVTPYLDRIGTEEQKDRWLPGCVSGEAITAIAMTEPAAGSDLGGILTRATRDGDSYVLNGQKTFITNGMLCDLVIVACKTDPHVEPRHKGISLIVVEDGTPGFKKGPKLKKMGRHASDTAELWFDDCRVPAANLLGEEGKGFYYLMENLQQERLVSTVGAQAAAEWAIEHSIEYCKERRLFGKPLSNFQNTQFKLAEAATKVQIGRVFLDRLIEAHMAGESIDLETSMAKWWITDMHFNVVNECLQLFGGYGYITEYPICNAFTDSRVESIFAGSNEVMKTIIAKRLGLMGK